MGDKFFCPSGAPESGAGGGSAQIPGLSLVPFFRAGLGMDCAKAAPLPEARG